MPPTVKIGFDQQCIIVPLKDLLPTKKISANVRGRMMYKRIASSIAEIGLVEPLIVYPVKESTSSWTDTSAGRF
jgi:hypothetical protein